MPSATLHMVPSQLIKCFGLENITPDLLSFESAPSPSDSDSTDVVPSGSDPSSKKKRSDEVPVFAAINKASPLRPPINATL